LKELKSKFKMVNPTASEETQMSDKTRTSPELSLETTLFLKEQVDRGIAEAVHTKDTRINELNEMLVQATKEKETFTKKLEAAEKIIDEFQRQTKDLKEQITGDKDLAKRYEAAVKIIDEAVKRLKTLGETQRRLAASNALLATSIARHKNEAVTRKVNSLIGKLDEKVQTKLRPMLMECETARHVQQRFNELASLVRLSKKDAQPRREGALPTRENRKPRAATLSESKSTRSHNDPITNRLLNRLSGVAH
jgi:phage shock protein A